MNFVSFIVRHYWVLIASLFALLSVPLWWPTNASAQGGTPAPSRPLASVVLDWTTKSEVNTAGFNLYRAERADGPFAQVNRQLIPAANDAVTGGRYIFTDTTTFAGVTYFYQLEDVEFSGARTRHNTISITASAATTTMLGLDSTMFTVGVVALGLIAGLGSLVWYMRHK